MSDFCLGKPMLQRVLAQAELMDRVMERIGVDALTAVRLDKGTAWHVARAHCIACCHDRQCREWLERTAESEPLSPPPHCENAKFFDLCRKAKCK